MELKITVYGDDIDDLVVALEDISRRVAIGSTIDAGVNMTEGYSFSFEVLPE